MRLRETLEAATSEGMTITEVAARIDANVWLEDHAAELAALALDMGELLLRILDRDHHGDFINGENAKPEDVAALLARLDQLGKEQT